MTMSTSEAPLAPVEGATVTRSEATVDRAGSTGSPRAWRGPRITRRRVTLAVLQLALLVAVIASWEIFSGPKGSGGRVLIDEYYVSKPSAVWDALQRFDEQGRLWNDILVTYRVTFVGFAFGAVSGVIVGFVLGLNRFLGDVVKPFISAINSIPRLALLPLFFIWFGLEDRPRVVLVASIVFFLTFYNTYAGIREVDQRLVDMVRVVRGRRRHVVAKVILPSAMTWIITSMHVSIPYALVAAVTAEIISSDEGMGSLLTQSSNQFFTAGVFASIVVMMAMASVLIVVVNVLERVLLRWKAAPSR